MRKQYRKFEAIKYAFVCAMIASFSVVAVAEANNGHELP